MGGSNSAAIWASVSCCRRISRICPEVKTGSPADPGQGVDERPASDAEDAANRGLGCTSSRGAGHAILAGFPRPGARAFSVCPLMLQTAVLWPNQASGCFGRRRVRRNGTVRCAIYTRKSSEEGLEQEFNSLQAQREACEAFINSQRHEGWVCLRAAYDDGGFSGATMDRPALQRLLADIAAGRVDTIVVYKIDRLARSLADFAKIVEILDTGASFVSVTQQFNTTTSMCRL